MFFQNIPKSTWDTADTLKKEGYLNRFKEKELVFYHSLNEGFDLYPDNFIKLFYRKNQLLVNSYYEKIVAEPFINKSYLLETKKHIFDKVFVYHILFGFNGCNLKASFNKFVRNCFLGHIKVPPGRQKNKNFKFFKTIWSILNF